MLVAAAERLRDSASNRVTIEADRAAITAAHEQVIAAMLRPSLDGDPLTA